MNALEATHSISADRQHAEVHFAIGGLWTNEAMKQFLYDLGEAAKPFMRERTPFSALGDLSEFVPQDRETAGAIRESLLQGSKNGLQRFAVVTESSLVKMQYRRLTEGLEVEFFDTVTQAKAWLREG